MKQKTNLDTLIFSSKMTKKHIVTSLGMTEENWYLTYNNNYGKLRVGHVHKLSELLEVEVKELLELIINDMKKQKL